MSKNTLISWAHHTKNLVWGCQKVSPGCKNCYALPFSKKMGYGNAWGPNGTRRAFGDQYWEEPYTWDRAASSAGERQRVFVGSMCDWAEDHPVVNQERERLWPVIRDTPNLDWLLLTKRPENIEKFLPGDWGLGYNNVWLMTSIENQQYANERIQTLLGVSAIVHGISVEPLLGPLDLLVVKDDDWLENPDWTPGQPMGTMNALNHLNWVIVGGESGPGARPFHLEWAEQIQRDCLRFRVPFFMKQVGANAWYGGERYRTKDRKGENPEEWPAHLRVRQFPEYQMLAF